MPMVASRQAADVLELRLVLRRGGPDGPEVECHRVGGAGLAHPRLPPDTWCLIPAEPLRPAEEYTVEVLGDPDRGWSFTAGR